MAVAAQEIDQPEDVGIGFVADDDRPRAGLDQPDAAEDQRAHDALAKVGFGDQQGAQAIRRDRDRLDVGPGDRVDQIGPARQLGELAEEIAALVSDDVGASPALVAGDLDLAGR